MHDHIHQLTLAASQALLDRLVQFEQRIAHCDVPDDLMTTAHKVIMRSCTSCGTCHPITLLCQNKACQECRGYKTYVLRRKIVDAISSQGKRLSHIVTMVFPGKAVPITSLSSKHIATLRQNFAKLRDRKCFKSPVLGGFYFIEIDFDLISFTARPHMHVILETKEVSKQKPIDFSKVKTAWLRLTGVSCEAPYALERNSVEDIKHVVSYITKQENGQENAIETLINLHDDIRKESTFVETDVPDEYAAYAGTVKRMLNYLTYVFNKALRKQRRSGFFGTWRNQKRKMSQGSVQGENKGMTISEGGLNNEKNSWKGVPWTCRSCGAHEYVIV